MVSTALMCPPTCFEVTYSINPWMQGGVVDKKIAMEQWLKLKGILEAIGATVLTVNPVPGLPDLVFTANAGTVRGNKIVLSNFRFEERQPETEIFEKLFQKEGYTTYRLPSDIAFEGCGDTAILGDKMFGGYGYRSTLGGLRRAAKLLDLELIPLKLAHPMFYHLDTCFCLINKHCAFYYPHAFAPSAIKKLKSHIPDLIPIDVTDATQFVCNSVVHGTKIIMPAGAQKILGELDMRGYEVVEINTSEFLKSGGSLQCMTLWI
jgi:N-dimethylarginine dimethylaminohydrolase